MQVLKKIQRDKHFKPFCIKLKSQKIKGMQKTTYCFAMSNIVKFIISFFNNIKVLPPLNRRRKNSSMKRFKWVFSYKSNTLKMAAQNLKDGSLQLIFLEFGPFKNHTLTRMRKSNLFTDLMEVKFQLFLFYLTLIVTTPYQLFKSVWFK